MILLDDEKHYFQVHGEKFKEKKHAPRNYLDLDANSNSAALLMGSEALEAGFIGNNVLIKEPPYTLTYTNSRVQRRNRFLSFNAKRNNN